MLLCKCKVFLKIMAKFKTHMGWGVFLGVALVVAGFIFSFFSKIDSAMLIFAGVLIGSFLPDLDLDGGVPFQILFGLLGAGFAGLVFFDFYQVGEKDLKSLLILPAMAFVGVRFVLGHLFEKFTNHRGIFHSIPAVFVFGLLAVWLLNLFSIGKGQEFMIGFAISVGYFGHLVLDEIYSSTNIHGHSLFPKQSLGSALKFTSSSRIATLFFYCLIIFLFLTLPETKGLF